MRLKGTGKNVRRVWEDSTDGDRLSRKPCYTVQASTAQNPVPIYLCLAWGQEAPASALLGLGEGDDTRSQCTCSGAVEPLRALEDTELTKQFEGGGCGDGARL